MDGKQAELASTMQQLLSELSAQGERLDGIGNTCAELLKVGAGTETSTGQHTRTV